MRERISPNKLPVARWVEIIEASRTRAGLRSTATVMFGHIEEPWELAEHMRVVRELQERTGGITEFVPLSFIPFHTLLGRTHGVEEISREENLKHTAVFRLALGRTIPSLQASWVKMGLDVATESLSWGVNDLGGTLMEESISRLAGSYHGVAPRPAAAHRRRPRRRAPGRRAHDALRRCAGPGRWPPRPREHAPRPLRRALRRAVRRPRRSPRSPREAEASGWDGFFVWDHVMTFDGLDVADPWIALTAVALATERLRLGAMVTPLARRRPWDVARQVAVLDRLSGGRMVFGAGLGGDSRRELTAFGEERDPRARAALLDEALELVVELWRGEPVTPRRPGLRARRGASCARRRCSSRARRCGWAACGPTAARCVRAARYDGAFPVSHSRVADRRRRARHARDRRRAPRRRRRAVRPRASSTTSAPTPSAWPSSSAAGATWWLQGFGERPRLADVQAAAAAGPPQ